MNETRVAEGEAKPRRGWIWATLLTVMGDALWRTEAAVELPGGGDAAGWVDDLAVRFDELGLP